MTGPIVSSCCNGYLQCIQGYQVLSSLFNNHELVLVNRLGIINKFHAAKINYPLTPCSIFCLFSPVWF